MKNQISIKVCSYRRSGTHLLMKSLSDNFLLHDVGKYVDTSNSQMEWYNNRDNKTMVFVPWIKLFYTHCYAHEVKFDKNEIIYVFRNGLDVLCSFHRSFNIQKDFNKWISVDIIKGWLYHIISWFEAGVYLVCFDDLINNFDNTMYEIGHHFNLKKKHDDFIKTNERIGWSPCSSNKKKKSIEIWDNKNLEMYNNIVNWNEIVEKAKEFNGRFSI